jgi:hypothetical protein
MPCSGKTPSSGEHAEQYAGNKTDETDHRVEVAAADPDNHSERTAQKHQRADRGYNAQEKADGGELPPLPLSSFLAKAMIIEPMTMPTTSGRKYWTFAAECRPRLPAMSPLEARNTKSPCFSGFQARSG